MKSSLLLKSAKWFGENSVSIATVVLVFAAWEAVVDLFSISPLILPAPSRIAFAIGGDWPVLLNYTLVTLYETTLGFAIGSLVAVFLAILLVLSRILSRGLYPIILFFQSVPKIAIAPLLLIWLGFGVTPKVVISVLVAFFPVVVNTAVGLNSVHPDIMTLARCFSPRRWDVLLKVQFPNSMPYIFAGLKIAITLAVIGAVVGEFAAASGGLGYLILVGTQQFETSLAFAALIMLTIMTIALYALISVSERFIVPWRTPIEELTLGRGA